MPKKKIINKRFEPDVPHNRLNKILSLQRQNDIIQLLLEGKERSEIVQYIANKYQVSPGTAGLYITDGANIIKERSNYEVNNMISLHIERYERIYELLYEIRSHGLAMKALRCKEKLLGFHKEGFHMRVQSGTISSVQLQTVNGEYDVMKLGKEKQNRMSELLQKAKADKKNYNYTPETKRNEKEVRMKFLKGE